MKITLCTVCYLEKENDILMLYRNKKENDINEGKWIGVGGHFEELESPYECAVREIREETGFNVNNLIPRGIITFNIENSDEVQYLYVFSSDDFSGEQIECNEGKLEWIARDKILSLNIWESDRLFMDKIINKDYSFFMVKASYNKDYKLINNHLEY